ncbi:MAG: conjugal transfer protein TraD [Rhodospirillales bacterium]|nr:conjugal transfer protein TraD [Rhodospirillales bacterium]
MLLRELQATAARDRRLTVLRNRLDRARARADTRDWVQERRARTRQLIELGGLVQKAGLVELVDDDRATLLGAFLELADQLRRGHEGQEAVERQGESFSDPRARCRRRGLRAFEADREASVTVAVERGEGAGGSGASV